MQLSKQAKVAKTIRQMLKADNVVGRVKSGKASMMTFVDIVLLNPTPATSMAVFEQVSQFESHTVRRDDVEQVTFVNTEARFTVELMAKAWDWARTNLDEWDWPAGKSLPYERVSGVLINNSKTGESSCVGVLVRQVLTGITGNFWLAEKARITGKNK